MVNVGKDRAALAERRRYRLRDTQQKAADFFRAWREGRFESWSSSRRHYIRQHAGNPWKVHAFQGRPRWPDHTGPETYNHHTYQDGINLRDHPPYGAAYLESSHDKYTRTPAHQRRALRVLDDLVRYHINFGNIMLTKMLGWSRFGVAGLFEISDRFGHVRKIVANCEFYDIQDPGGLADEKQLHKVLGAFTRS